MTKADIVNEIAKNTGVDKVTVLTTVEAFMDAVKDSLSKDENVYLRGFGSFVVKKRAQKTARNISKNVTIKIPLSVRMLMFINKMMRKEGILNIIKQAQMDNKEKLEINFDGCFGYPSSFLDEAFGGLAVAEKSHDVLNIIDLICNDDPKIIDDIVKSVKEAKI